MADTEADAFQAMADELAQFLEPEDYSLGSADPDHSPVPFEAVQRGHDLHRAVCTVQNVCFGGKPLPAEALESWRGFLRASRGSGDDRDDGIIRHATTLHVWALAQVDSVQRGSGSKGSCSCEEANRVAVKLAKANPTFVNGGVREWAEAIRRETRKTCSVDTVYHTSLWQETMEETGRGRGKGPTARNVSLTKGLEAVTGVGEQHQILKQLVADEEKARQAVEESGLSDEEAAAVLEKLVSGVMTPAQVEGVADLHPRQPVRGGKGPRS